MKNIVVFDLDDTLYKEIDFLKSGFFEISKLIPANNHIEIFNELMTWYESKENVFQSMISKYGLKEDLGFFINYYREHIPDISLDKETFDILNIIKKSGAITGLITDGFAITQRNKLKSLGLIDYFDQIIISEEFGSEKPNKNNYLCFQNKYGLGNYYYVGDNITKDFIAPNFLKWKTICLADNGFNIHSQKVKIDITQMAQKVIADFSKLLYEIVL